MQSFDEDGESLLCRMMWSYVKPDWSKAYLLMNAVIGNLFWWFCRRNKVSNSCNSCKPPRMNYWTSFSISNLIRAFPCSFSLISIAPIYFWSGSLISTLLDALSFDLVLVIMNEVEKLNHVSTFQKHHLWHYWRNTKYWTTSSFFYCFQILGCHFYILPISL